MKIRQHGILYAMALFAVILFSAGAQAAIDWTVPEFDGVDGVTSATQTLNANETATNTLTNVTFGYALADGVRVHIGEVYNDTLNSDNFNLTWDTTTIADQAGVTLIAIAYTGATNDTEGSASNLTGINIDNTLPTSTYGTANPAAGAVRDNSSATFQTASDTSLVNCTLASIPPFNTTASFTIVPISNVCTTQVDNIPNYAYNYNWTTTDGLNYSTFSARTLIVQTSEGSSVPVIIAGEVEAASKLNYGWIIIIAAVAVFVYNRKK